MTQKCLRFAVCIILRQPVPPDFDSGCGNAYQGVAAHNVRDSNPEQHHVYLQSHSTVVQSQSTVVQHVCQDRCQCILWTHTALLLHQLRAT